MSSTRRATPSPATTDRPRAQAMGVKQVLISRCRRSARCLRSCSRSGSRLPKGVGAVGARRGSKGRVASPSPCRSKLPKVASETPLTHGVDPIFYFDLEFDLLSDNKQSPPLKGLASYHLDSLQTEKAHLSKGGFPSILTHLGQSPTQKRRQPPLYFYLQPFQQLFGCRIGISGANP